MDETARTATMKPASVAGGRRGPAPAPRAGRLAEDSDIEAVVILFGFNLLAQTVFLRAQLRRELLAKILGLEDLPELDLGPAVERRLLEPFNRLVHRLHLPEPEAGDEFLRLGEGPVDHGPIFAGESHALTPRGWVKSLARFHDAGLHELLVVLAHRGQEIGGRHLTGFRFLARLHNHHDSHWFISSPQPLVERGRPRSTSSIPWRNESV